MAMPIQPIWSIYKVNVLDLHYCLAGSSKMTPRMLIFPIAMDADYSFDVKNIDFSSIIVHLYSYRGRTSSLKTDS